MIYWKRNISRCLKDAGIPRLRVSGDGEINKSWKMRFGILDNSRIFVTFDANECTKYSFKQQSFFMALCKLLSL